MAITTIYKCDKCGKELKKPEQFWKVSVFAEHWPFISNIVSSNIRGGLEVCRPCLESLGILAYNRTEKEVKENPPPTLEELIIELIHREVGQ